MLPSTPMCRGWWSVAKLGGDLNSISSCYSVPVKKNLNHHVMAGQCDAHLGIFIKLGRRIFGVREVRKPRAYRSLSHSWRHCFFDSSSTGVRVAAIVRNAVSTLPKHSRKEAMILCAMHANIIRAATGAYVAITIRPRVTARRLKRDRAYLVVLSGGVAETCTGFWVCRSLCHIAA
jgi:hypothetical protein